MFNFPLRNTVTPQWLQSLHSNCHYLMRLFSLTCPFFFYKKSHQFSAINKDATSSRPFQFTMCMLVGLMTWACHVIVDFCFTQSKTLQLSVLICLSAGELVPFEWVCMFTIVGNNPWHVIKNVFNIYSSCGIEISLQELLQHTYFCHICKSEAPLVRILSALIQIAWKTHLTLTGYQHHTHIDMTMGQNCLSVF